MGEWGGLLEGKALEQDSGIIVLVSSVHFKVFRVCKKNKQNLMEE